MGIPKQLSTFGCKIVNKILQWFQNKRSSHCRCSIKGILKNFAIFTGKYLRPSLLLIKMQGTPFQQNPIWNKCTCENLKPKLFNLRILASLCNFNYLKFFVKAKVEAVKFNSKISIIYHQIKFWKGIMNRSSIKMLFLKISQYSDEKAPTQVFSCEHCEIFKNNCFKEFLWTTVWTFCYMTK